MREICQALRLKIISFKVIHDFDLSREMRETENIFMIFNTLSTIMTVADISISINILKRF